jgi:hypothetical protein
MGRTTRATRLGFFVVLAAPATAELAAEFRAPDERATIKQALQAADDGDIIRIPPGEYADRVIVERNDSGRSGSYGYDVTGDVVR